MLKFIRGSGILARMPPELVTPDGAKGELLELSKVDIATTDQRVKLRRGDFYFEATKGIA